MDTRTHALLTQAADWRLIGRLFECPTGTWRDDIVALANRVGPPPSAAASPQAARLLPVIQPLDDEDEIAGAGTGGTDV